MAMTKMKKREKARLVLGDEEMNRVDIFKYLGSEIQEDGYRSSK